MRLESGTLWLYAADPEPNAPWSRTLRDVTTSFVNIARLLPCNQVDDAWPQLIAFFTRSPIRFSSAAVNFVNANPVAHIEPSSSFAESLKPNVA